MLRSWELAGMGGFTSKVTGSERWGLGGDALLAGWLAGWPEQKPVDGEPGRCNCQGVSPLAKRPKTEDGLGSRVGPTLTGHTATQPREDHSRIPAPLWGKPGANLGMVLSASDLEPQLQRWVPSHFWGLMGHDVERKQVEGSHGLKLIFWKPPS